MQLTMQDSITEINMQMRATVTIYFDNRGLANKNYSVKWYVYFNGKQILFSTGKIVTEAEVKFLKQYSSGLRGSVKDDDKRKLWYEVYDNLLKRAEELITDLGEGFSFSKFKELIKSGNQVNLINKKGQNNVKDAYLYAISELKSKGSFNYSTIHRNSYNSIARFLEEYKKYGSIQELKFSHVTIKFIEDYDFWMKIKGKANKDKTYSPASSTTISMYIRVFLKLLEDARFYNKINFAYNPTKKESYTPSHKTNRKRSLSRRDIKALFDYKPEHLSYDQRAVDLFLFSYLSNGLNFSDIFSLKNKSIVGGKIYVIRKKTKDTIKRSTPEIVIFLNSESQEILDRWRNKDKNKDAPLWSFLSHVNLDDPLQFHKFSNLLINTTNRSLKRISKKIGLSENISTYHARHSFATTLMQSHVPLPFISQALGHKSIATTQNYLGSFEDEQAKNFLSNLLPDND